MRSYTVNRLDTDLTKKLARCVRRRDDNRPTLSITGTHAIVNCTLNSLREVILPVFAACIPSWWVHSRVGFVVSEIGLVCFSDVELYIPTSDTENSCEVFQQNTCYVLACSWQKEACLSCDMFLVVSYSSLVNIEDNHELIVVCDPQSQQDRCSELLTRAVIIII